MFCENHPFEGWFFEGTRQTPTIEGTTLHQGPFPRVRLALSALSIETCFPANKSILALFCAFEKKDFLPLPVFSTGVGSDVKSFVCSLFCDIKKCLLVDVSVEEVVDSFEVGVGEEDGCIGGKSWETRGQGRRWKGGLKRKQGRERGKGR